MKQAAAWHLFFDDILLLTPEDVSQSSGAISQDGFLKSKNQMAEQGKTPLENNNIVHRNSAEDIKELMEKYSVTEEDIQVAIQIIGDHRDRIEKYLADNLNSRPSNIW
jgi:hypothetical protein